MLRDSVAALGLIAACISTTGENILMASGRWCIFRVGFLSELSGFVVGASFFYTSNT